MIYFPINLNQLTCPRDICKLMQNVKAMTYGMFVGNVAVKYGMSCDNEWKRGTWGNRIYRQAGGIPGWIKLLQDTDAKNTTYLFQKYLPNVHKNDVTFIINDYTQDIESAYQPEIQAFLLNKEHELVQAHEKMYGEIPILNFAETKENFSAYKFFNKLYGVEND